MTPVLLPRVADVWEYQPAGKAHWVISKGIAFDADEVRPVPKAIQHDESGTAANYTVQIAAPALVLSKLFDRPALS
tara:strand:- start:682 stop:909 length:228 start_codon:yes stop_codon:yes gene_type:complete